MIFRCIVVSVALALGACAPGSLSPIFGDRVRGDADQVVVKGFSDALEATPLAVAHCARFRRSAQYASRAADGLLFECRAK